MVCHQNWAEKGKRKDDADLLFLIFIFVMILIRATMRSGVNVPQRFIDIFTASISPAFRCIGHPGLR
jgi:hypothetical protein